MTKPLTPQQEAKLIKVIIKAVPEILDLKFGCEFIDYEGCVSIYIKQEEGGGKIHAIDKIFRVNVRQSKKITKIIGREIRLADVLIALRAKFENIEAGEEEACQWEEEEKKILDGWDLFKNSLSEQSPKTKRFLYELLNQNRRIL